MPCDTTQGNAVCIHALPIRSIGARCKLLILLHFFSGKKHPPMQTLDFITFLFAKIPNANRMQTVQTPDFITFFTMQTETIF